MELWYSPAFMLEAADLAVAECLRRKMTVAPPDLDKALSEGRPGAILCFSLGRHLGVEMWLRLVNPVNQAPDVEAMYVEQVGRSNQAKLLDIEIASYTRHSNEPLAMFMRRTKLDPKKSAYSSRTAYLFHIRRATTPDLIQEAHDELARQQVKGPAYLLGQVDDDLFQVVQAYPNFRGPDNVRISEILAFSQDPVVEAKRGMSSAQRRSDKPIPTENPYMKYLPDIR